jgi:hypothetical protein
VLVTTAESRVRSALEGALLRARSELPGPRGLTRTGESLSAR